MEIHYLLCRFVKSKILLSMFRLFPGHGGFLPIRFFLFFLFFVTAASSSAQNYDAFLEPNRIVDISSPIRGRISMIHVREGDNVAAGQLLAELDTQVLQAQLAFAEEAASFHGHIDSARAMVTLRKNRYAMLKELEKSGNARPQEMTRARTDLTMARAELLGAKDDQKLKKFEADIIRAQIEEKKLRSPVDGIVIKIQKEQSELIGGVDQKGFITVVQPNPLKALFHLPPGLTRNINTGDEVIVTIDSISVPAVVDYISPVIDAQSGTVELRVILENKENELLSGKRCILDDSVLSGGNDQNLEIKSADLQPAG